MSVKINSLEFENVKKIKAVQLSPTKNGLTVIGGRNGQGKTSVLDSIAWALGGDKFRPSAPRRDGSVIDPHLKIILDNGITVERSGKNSSLKVTDRSGNRGGQQLLNSFVESFALDLPRFLNQTSKEKADTLLRIIGVGDELYELENEEKTLYNQRRTIGQIADQKLKFAKEMPLYDGVPAEPVSASDLIKQQQNILAQNGENQRLRAAKAELERQANELDIEIKEKSRQLTSILKQLETARKTVAELHDESTEELEKNIFDIEETNKKVRANLDREKAEIEAESYSSQYNTLTSQIEDVRAKKTKLLDGADLPLPGLNVQDGELTYNGYKWDNMSSSEQLIVATSIVRKLNPSCGFVLLDKLEQLDTETLNNFGVWLEGEGLQAIATRVSTGDECSIIIEDGITQVNKDSEGREKDFKSEAKKKQWKAGEF